MVTKMEDLLVLDEKENRKRIRLRLDGGFGTDANINFAPQFRPKERCSSL
jgi:hypothetical protein